MKKLEKSQSKKYGPVLVKRAHLDEIYSIMLERGDSVEIRAETIESEDCIFESFDELGAYLKDAQPKSLSISSKGHPSIEVSFRGYGVGLYVGGSTDSLIGIYHRLDEVISRSERRPRLAYSASMYTSLLLLSTLGLAFKNNTVFSTVLMYVTLGLMFWSWWALYVLIFRKFKVVLTAPNAADAGLLSRFIYWLINNTIPVILGSVSGAVAVYLLERYR